MAANIYDWDIVEANNATADTALTWAEGQAPSTVNNSARVMMRRGKELLIDLGGSIAAGGTANALTLTAQSAFTTLANGRVVTFKAIASNTDAATINVNAIGAKAIVKMTSSGESPLTGGEIQNTGMYKLQYSTALAAGVGAWLLMTATASGAPKGHLNGLSLSNSIGDATNDIDIAVGECASDTAPYYLMTLASALTKRLDANWVVGTNQGGLDTGSIANTTYHVWLIQRSDTGVVDVLFSASATAPTMPANYDRKRRIGSILRESATIVGFYQYGDIFRRTVALEINGTTTAYAAVLTNFKTPLGIVTQPITSWTINTAAASSGVFSVGSAQDGNVISSPAGAIGVPTGGAFARAIVPGGFFTNASAQMYVSLSVAVGSLSVASVACLGWIDMRDRT